MSVVRTVSGRVAVSGCGVVVSVVLRSDASSVVIVVSDSSSEMMIVVSDRAVRICL